ncbi:MAG: bifunctional aldolase/short-chain dehydrogenase [Proteobacteria bacterium]|nr:bifunctional aldolase/short-chain dehydrogenase [Pseudomonadota bacterium]MDA0926706.1 bifunctional aldolase/short-chain dehydrogenase [Pseudomonadota bacterium]
MKNRWDTELAKKFAAESELGLRVYSSNLLGADPDLVLHGGGNTSVKGEVKDVFGQLQKVLFVKGSGWDLRTIEEQGFPPVRLDYLQRLGALDSLSDSEMMRQLRLALLDPSGPTPSVEAILHALIPHKYVDHTHADAVVTISNSPNGEQILWELYGEEVLILPYIMPGFILARQVAAATSDLDWSSIRGIILLHHGIFTFDDDARASYDAMIELVDRAEQFLQEHASTAVSCAAVAGTECDLLTLAAMRKAAGAQFGGPVLARFDHAEEAAGFAMRDNAGELATRGPLTPDHTIHCKAFAARLGADPVSDLEDFAAIYRRYFDEFSTTNHQCLDTMPRYAVWQGKGMVYFAANHQRLQIVEDISSHTIRAIQQAEALGGWQALPRSDLFEVEHWELEQAKLKAGNKRGKFEGQVALVSGAASGIGKACVEALRKQGAVVAALDIAPEILSASNDPALLPLQCDVTCTEAIREAVARVVCKFGGIDLLVSNAGNFPASASLGQLDDKTWQQSLDLNLSSHMKLLRACLPFLELGFKPAVIMVGSKNVPAPGPGAAAYSTAKAGLTQLARVAALELGASGIRVNTVHPNAVYDTALWNDEVLAQRAAHYGKSVEDYRKSNVLRTELNSADVANSIVALLGDEFAKTTGEQIAIDGGNDRVI